MLPVELTKEERYILSLDENELLTLGLDWGHHYRLEHQDRVWELHSGIEAHKSVPFPDVYKGEKSQQIDLKDAIVNIYSLAAAYLASDCEYHSFDAKQSKQIEQYVMAFETLLHRRPVSRRLEPAAIQYFEDTAFIANALYQVDWKMR